MSFLVRPNTAREYTALPLSPFSLRLGLAFLLFAGLAGSLLVARPAAGQAAPPSPASERAALLDPHHPLWSRQAPATFRVRLKTSEGFLYLEAYRDWAPRGVDRFYQLVLAGFFDDSRFFRVVPGFIAQFGLPGDPAVNAAWKERAILDDPAPSPPQSNRLGTFAFAMTGPDTRSTQIFLNLADNSRLDAQGFRPLGRVFAGWSTAEQLYSGYGEGAGGGMRGGKQGEILARGNAHLDSAFPKLSRLLRILIWPDAEASASQAWEEWRNEKLGFRLLVPMLAPQLERALRAGEASSSPQAAAGKTRVRLQNYSEADLAAGEVPSLQKGQFWIEVEVRPLRETERPDHQELRKDCLGEVFAPEPEGGTSWCRYDPARLEGEGTITHIGWVAANGTLYRAWMNAQGLEPEVPGTVLRSLAPLR